LTKEKGERRRENTYFEAGVLFVRQKVRRAQQDVLEEDSTRAEHNSKKRGGEIGNHGEGVEGGGVKRLKVKDGQLKMGRGDWFGGCEKGGRGKFYSSEACRRHADLKGSWV